MRNKIDFSKLLNVPLYFPAKLARRLLYTVLHKEAGKAMDKHKNKIFAAAAQAAATRERFLQAHTVRSILRISAQFLLSAILARATVFGGFAPFGAAMAGAMCSVGGGVPAVVGVFFGYLFLRPAEPQAVAYAASSLLTLCTAHVFADAEFMRQRWFLPTVTTMSLGACTFVFLPAASARWMALFLCSLVLTAASCWFYMAALSPPPKGLITKPSSFLVVTATLLLSVSDLMVFGRFSPARVLAVLIVMGASCLCGSAVGTAVGVAFGITMDAAGAGGAYFTCLYAFSALAAGAFREAGRRLFAVFFAVAAGCAALLGLDRPVFLPSIYEIVVAALMFAALPTSFWDGVSELLLPERTQISDATARLRQTSRRRAGEAAQAFYEMYLSMMAGAQYGKATADEESHAVFDAAAERVCRKCQICAYCWQKDYVSTLSALSDVAVPMLRRGRAEANDFPQHFSSRCVHFPELLRTINEALYTLREREEYRERQEENRSLIARQYAGITGIFKQMSAGLSQDFISLPAREKQVRKYAQAFGATDQAAVFRDGLGRLRVELTGEGLAEIMSQKNGFTAGLSALLAVGLTEPVPVKDELGERLVLREQASFRAIVGVGQQQKEGERVSGDTGRYFLTEDGIACLLLCDGMGTGSQAARDSRNFLGLLERFLQAGVPIEDALKAVAPSYRIQCDGRRFVTLDALTVDLFTGRATSMKCGAAPSYMITSNGITRLNNAALPVGLSEEEGGTESVPLRFAHGDIFILLSDGVSDGTDDTWVRDLLRRRAGDSPKELAARLVMAASERGGSDDMTALVLRLEKRAAARARSAPKSDFTVN